MSSEWQTPDSSRPPDDTQREGRSSKEREGLRPADAHIDVPVAADSAKKRQEPVDRIEFPAPNDADQKRLQEDLFTYKTELEELKDRLEKTQIALDAAEERYHDLYFAAPIAFLTVGAHAKILSCNRHAADLLGIPAAAAHRRRITDFMLSESLSRFMECRETLFPDRQPIILDLEMRRANGNRFWAEFTMVLSVEGGANICRIALTDQTARKRMQAGAAQLAAIVTSADQAIISEDLEGYITSWNAGAEKLFGYTAQQTQGYSIEILVPADRLEEERDFRACVRRGETVAQESVRLGIDGTAVPVFVAASPILGPKGHVIGISQIVRDITEQIAGREEVTRLLEDLRKADRRKDDFIATLAHELRNPLAPIRNAAAVMRFVQDLDPKLQWCRDVIDRQVGHMAALLEDLLDISRLTRDLIKLRRDRVELGSAIAQAIEITRPLIDSLGHTLDVELPSEPVEVEGDLTRLTQIFGNLLNNAAKYTEPNGQINVRVEQRGPDVVIRVRDSGMGITQENLTGIFDLFAQVDPARESQHGGLGIGLALVKGLVERHRGTIVAESEGVGRGSEFIITLPAARPASSVSNSGEVPEWHGSGTRRSLRVLIVDDNVDAAESMAMMLRNSHHDVHTASDGETALAKAAELRPDAIVLDLGMPKMSGYEVASRLRKEPWGADVFVVACTGWGQPEDRRRSQDAGFNRHLVKPVSLDAVLQLLDDLADAKPG